MLRCAEKREAVIVAVGALSSVDIPVSPNAFMCSYNNTDACPVNLVFPVAANASLSVVFNNNTLCAIH